MSYAMPCRWLGFQLCHAVRLQPLLELLQARSRHALPSCLPLTCVSSICGREHNELLWPWHVLQLRLAFLSSLMLWKSNSNVLLI